MKKKKLAALNKEKCEQLFRRNLAQNSNVPRSQEGYITQIFEEIGERVTKKLSQEFSRTGNPILDALARLDDFLMNPLPVNSGPLRSRSGVVPERIWLKPGNEWGQLPEGTPSWSRHLSEPDYRQLWHTRWWQEFTRKLRTAPPVHLQENRRKSTALPVNCNSPVKTFLLRSKQTNFCRLFSSWQKITILQFFLTT